MKRTRVCYQTAALLFLAVAAPSPSVADGEKVQSPNLPGAATTSLELPGSLEAFEQVDLYAKVSGYLETINVDIGDHVRVSDVIAVLNIPEMVPELQRAQTAVVEARSNLEKARADANLAEVTYKRFSDLYAREPEAITKQEVDVAEAQRAVAAAQVSVWKSKVASAEAEVKRIDALMAYATIKAPFDGVITKRYLDTGALIVQGTGGGKPLVEIMRTDKFRLVLHIPEPAVRLVNAGCPASITFDALADGGPIETSVTRCSGSLMPDTRSMRAEIELSNSDQKLKPGMFAKVRLDLKAKESASE